MHVHVHIYIYLDNCIYIAACMVVYTCFYSDINGGPPNSLINCMSRSCNGILHTLIQGIQLFHHLLSRQAIQANMGIKAFGVISLAPLGIKTNQNHCFHMLSFAFIYYACMHVYIVLQVPWAIRRCHRKSFLDIHWILGIYT